MMKSLIVGCALIAAAIASPVLATDSSGQPTLLSDEQMDLVIAGGVVDTQGQNLELIAPGNNINSCNSGQCYWFNVKSGKEIGKPAPGA